MSLVDALLAHSLGPLILMKGPPFIEVLGRVLAVVRHLQGDGHEATLLLLVCGEFCGMQEGKGRLDVEIAVHEGLGPVEGIL